MSTTTSSRNVSASLNTALRKDASPIVDELSDDALTSIEKLYTAVANTPVLVLPMLGLPYKVDCNAGEC